MRVVRVLIGYALACLAAALTLVLFVYTPAELASLPMDMSTDRISEAGVFALVIVPYVATFAGLPALVGVVFAEVRKIAAWTFYALLGVAIAALGFLVQHFSEAPGQATILQNYALTAFLVAGLVAGFAYWLFSGRLVGRVTAKATPPASQPPPEAVPTGT